jgi:aldehyde dehydrogenase (NAD+)
MYAAYRAWHMLAPMPKATLANPANPTPPASAAALQSIFDSQLPRALELRSSTAAQRIAKIRRLRDAVLANREAIQTAAFADSKKPAAEVDMAEILPVCMEANDAMRHLKRWMQPQRVWPTLLTLGTRSLVQTMPRGRCLILSPWNYPLNLTFGPLVSAIAAGNTVVLKPSELTPNMSALMARIVRETFATDEVALVEGEADVASTLLALPFNHIFFTGSPAIGKLVMAAAARHLSSVTLELGGKSPTIVDASADLEMAAQNILWAKFSNAGQTCIAPDHVYVHASVKERWLDCCRSALALAYGASPQEQQRSPHLARIVNARHTSRVNALLQDALARGATLVAGGVVDEADCFVAPTLLDRVPPEARIMEEEIFGPLLPVISFDRLDDVIATINAGPNPLALYVYSRTEANIQQVLHHTASGGACVNHALLQFMHAHLPFGGVNNSGLGQAHGHYGFNAFSHEKAVLRAQTSLATRLYRPGAAPGAIRRFLGSAFTWL